MAKSTPIAVIKQQQQQNPEIHEDQSDDVVQDVLSSLNNEHFQQQQQAPASAPLYADLVADANSHPYAGAEAAAAAAAAPGHVQPFSIGPLTTDLKLAAICMAVFVAVTQIPLEKIIYSYIALDKLPFSEVLVKGAIAGALFYFLTRLIT
jgi:hypothetical protein